MAKSNHIHRRIWLVLTGAYNFTIVARDKKDCKELIDEITEGSISTESLNCKPIGNVCPTLKFYDTWEGESMIIATNFYDK